MKQDKPKKREPRKPTLRSAFREAGIKVRGGWVIQEKPPQASRDA